MRSLGLIFVVAACGSEEGTLLTIHAPDGPITATRIDIILASADPATIANVPSQRIQPMALAAEPVRYYRQRAIASAVGPIDPVDGFQMRLEANSVMVPDTTLIPFLIASDDGGHIVGIGTVVDGNGDPMAIDVLQGQLVGYDVSMPAISETDGAAGIAAGTVQKVRCDSFDSGLAFKPGSTQLRLLFPDLTNDPNAVDASTRTLDLDCDGNDADRGDCDDLRPEFHRGAVEACDGKDVDCDGRLLELVSCTTDTALSCGTGMGIRVCADVAGPSPSTGCLKEPACACQNSLPCNVCEIVYTDSGSEKQLCEPYRALSVQVPGCGTSCNVEVLDRLGNPWRVQIALPNGQLGSKVTNVTDGIDIQAVPDNDRIPGMPLSIVGAIYLAVTPVGGANPPPTIASWALRLEAQSNGCTMGPTQMNCVNAP